MQKPKYELLAPAGNFTNLKVAVKAGADAVYFGLKSFSMRANAKNFEFEDLKKIREICNKGKDGRKVKMYLTMNIIIYDDEFEKLEDAIKKVKGKIDAIICWDMAVISLCKKYKIPFHISTQASTSNAETAKFFKSLGAERIVLARELNLKQIKNISEIPGMEIECFCHGAMCIAISGRCLMSEHQIGMSANRGKCVQPCRRSYTIKDDQGKELKIENNHILSAKDLCTLPFIEELKKAGITSFKIEGRNRDPRYIDTVIRVYRKALDKKLSEKEIEESMNELEKVYNKGFSSGFYKGLPTSDDISKVQNSAAKEKKIYVGKIKNFLSKLKVSIINITPNETIKTDDKILIIGNKTGVFESKIKSLEIKGNKVESASQGDEVAIKLSSLPKDNKLRKNDDVYVLRENLSE